MSEIKEERIVEAILAGGVKIPPIPQILMECEALGRDDDAGPHEFATLISRDAGLTGALFRLAASPVFGLRNKSETLEKAITTLGLKTTLAVVHGEALRKVLLSEPDLTQVMNNLWLRMNDIAEQAVNALKVLKFKGINQDQAFMLGIFHDCGIAILCRRFPDYALAFQQGCQWPDLLALDETHQTHHAVAGQMVARNWQLPQEIILAIRHHHDTDIDHLPDNVRKLIILLQFAIHQHNKQTQGDDSEWKIWQPHLLKLMSQERSQTTKK